MLLKKLLRLHFKAECNELLLFLSKAFETIKESLHIFNDQFVMSYNSTSISLLHHLFSVCLWHRELPSLRFVTPDLRDVLFVRTFFVGTNEKMAGSVHGERWFISLKFGYPPIHLVCNNKLVSSFLYVQSWWFEVDPDPQGLQREWGLVLVRILTHFSPFFQQLF